MGRVWVAAGLRATHTEMPSNMTVLLRKWGGTGHKPGAPWNIVSPLPQLGAGQTPGELLNPLVLNSILSKALQYSLHGDTPHAANLSFALKYLPEVFAPNAPDVLSCLELRYKVSSVLPQACGEVCPAAAGAKWGFLNRLTGP